MQGFQRRGTMSAASSMQVSGVIPLELVGMTGVEETVESCCTARGCAQTDETLPRLLLLCLNLLSAWPAVALLEATWVL